jgi:hypothetical protein
MFGLLAVLDSSDCIHIKCYSDKLAGGVEDENEWADLLKIRVRLK